MPANLHHAADLFISRLRRHASLRAQVGRFGTARKLKAVDVHTTGARNVVAFSLYGHSPRYVNGVIPNIIGYAKWFPEFVCRFYVARDVGRPVLNTIRDMGAEVFVMASTGVDPTYMFWRLLAAEDISKERFLIRDVDSVPSERERHLYNAWQRSGLRFNVIRDHCDHNARVMGGLWGGYTQPKLISSLLTKSWRYANLYGRDQRFLTAQLYPRIHSSLFVQDIVHRFADENVAIHAIDSIDYSFVGEITTDPAVLHASRARLRSFHLQRASEAQSTIR